MITKFCPFNVSPNLLSTLRFCRQNSDGEDSFLKVLNSPTFSEMPVQSLLPLIYFNTKRSSWHESIDKQNLDLLRMGALRAVGKELAYGQLIEEISTALGDNEIPIILLKGAAFSGNIYTPEAPRPGVDIDFLVKLAHFEKACEILNKTMEAVLLAENRVATHNVLFERMFKPIDKPFPVVEVHRGLTNPHIFNINEDSLWQTSQPHPAYNNEFIRILSPEDTLLHLATHAFRDLDFCTHTLLDVHELFRQKPIDPDLLLYRARKWGAGSVLYCLLHNARTIMGTPVPDELLQSLRPGERKLKSFKNILQSKHLAQKEKSPEYRRLQIKAQLVFPDRLSNAIRFQGHYLSTRIRDLVSR